MSGSEPTGTDARPHGRALAVVVCRAGRLPAGADETVAEAGGRVILVGEGTLATATELPSARLVWCHETKPAGPAALAVELASLVAGATLVVLPASPDGRDLAPRLAAILGWPILAGAIRVAPGPSGVQAELIRADGRVAIPVESSGPAVATLMPGARAGAPAGDPPVVIAVDSPGVDSPGVDSPGVDSPGVDSPGVDSPGVDGQAVGRTGLRRPASPDPEVVAVVAPDPATMDLADATRVLSGGAGLVPPGGSDKQARAIFDLLSRVAHALGASAGATRVVTDAGWLPYDRQIGTTGVAIDPDLYVAFGVSGASQHTGGLGAPRNTVSVNVDPSCPMTAMADLGLVADARALLVELAGRLGVEVGPELRETDG